MGQATILGAFYGWYDFRWDTKASGNMFLTAKDNDHQTIIIADVMFRAKKWHANVMDNDSDYLERAVPSAFAGRVAVERCVRSHGGDIPESLAAWLVRMREAHGYSMNSLATAAGVHQSTVRAIEVDGCVPKPETLEKLRRVFKPAEDVSVDQERMRELEARVANLERLIGGRA